MAVINWTDYALRDLEMIADFIALDSELYAKKTINELYNAVLILEEFQYLGRVIPEFKQENLRELISGNYRTIYKIISSQRIDILTVFHSKRDLKSNFNKN